MKKLKGLLLAVTILVSGFANAQEKDKDVMIRKIFSTLKAGDEEAFVKLFPDAALMKTFLQELFERDTSRAVSKEMINTFLQGITDEDLAKEYKRDFQRAIRYAADNGVDLAKTRLVNYTADSLFDKEGELKVTKLSGKMYINEDTAEYFIAYNDIIWFDNKGWYGVNIRRIDLKSREFDPEPVLKEDTESVMMTDTVMEADTAMAPPPPPPPVKKKVPAKPTGKPIKAKTTAAARKPEQ